MARFMDMDHDLLHFAEKQLQGLFGKVKETFGSVKNSSLLDKYR